MRPHQTVKRSLAATLAAVTLAACADAPVAAPSHALLHSGVSAATAQAAPGLLKEVHAAVARFHSTTQATQAGYAVASPCIEVQPLGGMGFHWVNQALVDPVFDPLAPEALVYAPDANGNVKLVAAEYIVINVGQPAPTFDGQAFDVGGTPVPVAHWSLHVWAFRDNPAGVFTPFNPDVSCTP
jgi:hypothetical protein